MKELALLKITKQMIEDCVDLYIETFTKEPWISGFEYYIDEFCVSYEMQGTGIGSKFMKAIEEDIKTQGMNALILNTEKNYPSQKFYEKNGFETLGELIIMAK